ncbi:MAG: sigma-54-dependent Fis family transcriptional regulator [Gammaproteobacteria bacterium]
MANTELLKHEERIYNVLAQQGTADIAMPESFVVDSWRRCIDQFGLVPKTKPKAEVLEAAALKQMQDELGEFMQVADEECRNLFKQTTQSGYVIVLTNTDGVILSMAADPALEEDFQRFNLQPGAVWNEQHHGTNGMGTCLHNHRPVIIHGDDHFFNDYRGVTCTATPIHDPHGEVMAVLDASSFQAEGSKRGQIHTRALVQMAANFIEYKYFQHYFKHASVLSFHPRYEFLGVGTESLLALDDGGLILGANASALKQLEFEDRKALIDRSLDEIFAISTEDTGKMGSSNGYGITSAQDLKSGRRFLTMFHQPPKPQRQKKARQEPLIKVPSSDNKSCLDLKSLAGNDPHMAYNVRCIRRVVDKNIYILLNGETGSGKEVFARAIHDASDRKGKPFVALNCAAIPETLIESELFGYKAGAFTGARREGMRGCVLESSGGTLFLDEIGDMPLHLQTRLLRVLETKEVLPLGSQVPVTIDLHVISATHQDLRELIALGKFRQDLFYRLNGITLKMPSLREREDLDSLIRCAIALENDGKEPISIERKAFNRLKDYDWPGNIRELCNIIRTSIALSDDNLICLADLPKEIAKPEEYVPEVDEQVASVQQDDDEVQALQYTPLENAVRETILREIEHNRWNVTVTAKKLHMTRCTLYRKLKKYNIPITPPE